MKSTVYFYITLWGHLFSSAFATSPNFLFIMGDDVGYNDVGYNNDDVYTPNIDDLASTGQTLEQHYVQPLCTPSRSAFLTGMYPFHLGTQGDVLEAGSPTGLTLDYSLLPEYLSELGYTSHLVGKWHLGFCKTDYLPTYRGFDTSYGYWNGAEDYYTKKSIYNSVSGFDFHEGTASLKSDSSANATYSTYLYRDRVLDLLKDYSSDPFFIYLAFQSAHSPVSVPSSYESYYSSLSNSSYKTYYAAITAMDEAIGEIVDELKTLGVYENTIIVYMGDNGASSSYASSNLPFRGSKDTIYEGGTKTAAFIHSPLLSWTGENDNKMHITDWMPTFLELAGSDSLPSGLDGVSQVDNIFADSKTAATEQRTEIVYNVKLVTTGIYSGAVRSGDYKLVINPKSITSAQPKYLYDLSTDPYETTDVKTTYSSKTTELYTLFQTYISEMVSESNATSVTSGVIVGGSYVTGWC